MKSAGKGILTRDQLKRINAIANQRAAGYGSRAGYRERYRLQKSLLIVEVLKLLADGKPLDDLLAQTDREWIGEQMPPLGCVDPLQPDLVLNMGCIENGERVSICNGYNAPSDGFGR